MSVFDGRKMIFSGRKNEQRTADRTRENAKSYIYGTRSESKKKNERGPR